MSRHPVLPFRGPDDYVRHASRVAEHLRGGGLIAYPTETVYGLGCVLRADALARLARVKRQGRGQPFLLLVDAPDAMPGVTWTEEGRRLAQAFWPGPLTLVVRAAAGRYPAEVTGPEGTVAVRASPHPAVQALLRELGEPITSTSANRPGERPASSAVEVQAVLDDLAPEDPFWILDGGALPPSPPSTLVDVSGARARLLRAGAVAVDDLKRVVDEIDERG